MFTIFLLSVSLQTQSWLAVPTQFSSGWGLVGGGCLVEACEGGSRGPFRTLYLPSFYLVKRTRHLSSKRWGDPDENYLGHRNSLLLLATAWSSYTLSPHLPQGPPLGLRLGVGWNLAYGESPSLCPPTPEFYKELAWVPEAQRKHTGRDTFLRPSSFSSFDLGASACPC